MRRLLAVARYLLVELLAAQRVLVPVVVFVLLAGVLLAGDHVAAPGPWPATTLALYAVAAWIGLVTANAEDPVARTVTVAAAGGPGPVTVATALVALAVSVVLALLVVLVPGLVSPGGFPPAALVAGLLAHLAAAVTGCGIGMITARPLISRVGWSFVLTALVVVVTAVQPWLPPVGTAVEALSTASVPSGALVVALGVAVVVLVACGVASWAAARRA